MRKPRRFKSAEDEIEAIRKEPAFRALVNDLKQQTEDQHERLGEWLDGQAGEDGDHERAE